MVLPDISPRALAVSLLHGYARDGQRACNACNGCQVFPAAAVLISCLHGSCIQVPPQIFSTLAFTFLFVDMQEGLWRQPS